MSDARVEDLYPLTPLQRGMLFHTELAPEAGDYLAQLGFTLGGALDPATLERAWRAVLERHPALRTAFVWKGVDDPVQVVLRHVELPFEVEDWRGLDPAAQEARLAERLAADRRRGFDPARAPLMRVHLARLADERWRVTWTSHHLLLDGWSLPLVLGEVFEARAALARGAVPSDRSARPYRDYVAWLGRRDAGAAEAFWREHLRGARPTPLPGVRPRVRSAGRAAAPSGGELDDWGDAWASLSPAETERVAALARRHGLTTATVVQGAWALLVARLSGRRDVLFGVTRSGRPAELDGVEEMVGMFVNTLPFRVPVPPDTPAAAWLKDLQARAAELAPHEWSALSDVAAWSELDAGEELFESLVVFENYPLSEAQGAGLAGDLELGDVRSLERTSYPVNLVATPGRRLTLRLSHDAQRVDAALAERWVAALRRLCLDLADEPEAPLAARLAPDADERRLIVEEWARGPEPGAPPACLAELFEAQVDRAPDATAVECAGTTRTYAELDAAANRLARVLAARGLGGESLVGLCLDRTADLAVGILGIAKAGAAWLPLDPAHPPARLAQVAREAGAEALVTVRRALARVPELEELTSATVVLEDVPGDGDATRPGRRARPENLAYVIYTSGSTGAPKGVEVPHRGLGNLARETAAAAGLGPGKRVLQLSSIGFDVSVLEVLGALLSGATLSLLGEDRPAPGPELAARVRATGAHVLFAPPSVLRELDPDDLPSVETVFSGGEACTAELSAAWNGTRRLINAYGPAEATVTAVQNLAVADEPDAPGIGRPLRGVRAYVLDRDLAPVPVGSVGELYLGGVGVARGYRGRRAFTAERFLPDPFAGEPGARLYRTGDLARWRPPGPNGANGAGGAVLEFCGRADRQLKVGGVRVEPGEVEAVLLAHPDVERAAVDGVAVDGEPRLAAWYVPRAGADPGAGALRAHLAARLPAAFVPSHLVPLDALPLSPSGKVDRAALPAPAARRGTAGQSRPRARAPIQELVCALAAEVLGLPAADVGDDFFALGGHSLRAMQLASRLRGAAGVDVPLREVFAAATLGELARRVAALRDAGRAADRGLPAPGELAASAGPSRPGEPRPLTFAQQRLWFLDRFEPDSPLYVVPAAVWLEGALDAGALERALQRLVDRHAALRTRLEDGPDGPRQVVEPRALLAVVHGDLRGEPDADGRARERARADALRPFDLGTAPLVRASLLRTADARHLLVLALHHAVIDGWSVGILVRELGALYAEEAGGPPAALPPLELEYADYAAWQRDPRVETALAGHLAYWERELADAPAALDLPTDRPRPPVQTFAGRSLKLALEPELVRRLHRLARRHDATPFLVLFAAFQAWLARLAGQEDVVVGVPIAGRDRPGVEPLVGLFVNTLALRGRLGDDPRFLDHLARTRERVLAGWEHQDAPFERLVERLTGTRDLARAPLAQVLFVMQNLSVPDLALPGVRAEVEELDTGTAKFDLSLLVDERPGSGGEPALELTLEFNTDLFDDATAGAWLASFRELLRSVVADPGRRVSELAWVGDEERALLEAWGTAPATHPRDATVPALFARQVARAPDAVAVAFGEDALTYAQLDARSNRLARHLRGLGVGPEAVVALSCERSLEMVAGLLAILKAGAAYLPLDPLYPAERRRWMLAESGAAVLMVQPGLAADLPAPEGVPTVLLDDAAGAGEDAAPLPPLARPEHLAYLMYTSGSTGTPKGVGVPHRAVARLLAGEPFVRLGPGEVVLQFVSIAFDVSVFEIWGALLSGARLEVFPPRLPSLAELGAFVRDRGVTTAWLTTGLFDQMVETEVALLAGLRQLLAGGEALSAPHVERALRELPGCRVVNGYGPTEVTCFTTTHAFPRGERVPTPVPIGRPVNGTRVHVLDENLRPVPRGVRGELYAAGDGVARGYLNDAARTAARFVPDPFGDEPGARLYRIGDRVRWRSDGTLEFGGRVDRQVKVRGHRVELGEIEAALLEHPAVLQCAVELRGEGDAKRPVAWIATRAAPAARELRDFLRRSLPEPVLPAFFVLLAELPLTPNGKVDRRALPAPAAPAGGGAPDARPPTPDEELLAGMWQELLGCHRVGPGDDFFELGGHSLLATRLAARVREVLDVELPLARLFERSTLAELAREVHDLRAAGAARLASAASGAAADSPAPLAPRPAAERVPGAPLPLSFAQERLWFLERFAPGNPAHHTPIALELEGDLDTAALRGALEELARRHEVLRTRLLESRGAPVQEVAPPESVAVALPVDDLSDLAGEALDARLCELQAEEIRRPFDLERDVLLRARLARLEPRRHVLTLCVHHVASDGWSLSVLTRELSELYRCSRAGERPSLAEPGLQYADFALWQRRAVGGERLERELAWWRAELEGSTRRLELGTPAAPGPSAAPGAGPRRGGGLELRLAPALARRLEQLARREGATLYMVLLAAFQAVLGRLAGRDRFVVGSPIAGRRLRETEDVVGPFVNLLALRADLRGDPEFRQLLARVRAVTLDAYAHADLPVEQLADRLRPEGDPRGGELFQVSFTLHNTPRARLELPGLEVRRRDVQTGVAFGELWLSVEAAGDGALEAYWHHDAELLAPADVGRLAAAWERFLAAAAEEPATRLSALPLVTDDERARLLALGAAPATHPRDATVPELFERAARARRDAIALRCGDDELSYGELSARANRLARWLRGLGVGPEVPVGVVCERSPELFVALLGILKAGGAYVPLDPAWPERRIARALELVGAPVVLTQERLLDDLPPAGPGGPFAFALDAGAEAAAIAAESAEEPPPLARAENLAYAMFTSGSTGEPRPVGVSHRAIARLLAGEPFAPLEPGDAVLQLAPLAFDASTFEVWGALLAGARLEAFPPGAPSLAELGAFVRERGVTALWLTAGLFHQLVDERAGDLAGVRWLLAGGEALSPPHVRRAVTALSAGCLVNGYGPTELTTFTCCHPFDAPPAPEATSVPIGRPINGTRAYVLDRELAPAPLGAWGELCASGDGVARGYLGDPRLTAERFVPDPLATAPGARMFRTGDRGRWNEDGALEFGGRLDRQVKLRGYRVEPGEVEAVLAEHPAVRAAAVDARGEGAGRRLGAWVAAAGPVDPAELREHVRERCPEFLVPAFVVVLDELPLTANGKVDRRALAEPRDGPGDARGEPPRTPDEELVAGTFAELLGRAAVARDDDFFDLGGHSLLATQLASRARELLGVELPLHVVFEHPTPAALARAIADLRGAGGAGAPPLVPVPRDGDLPLSFGQERLWFLERLEPGSPRYHAPFALELRGPLDAAALRAALDGLVERHEALRTGFPAVDGRPRQAVAPRAAFPLEEADLSALAPAERAAELLRLERETARRPFDVAAGPLARATLVALAPDEHALLLCLHHAVSDGWSLGVLVRELSELYRFMAASGAGSAAAGRAPRLDPLPVQVADHAAWQRAWMAGERLDRELAWWRAELRDAPQRLELAPRAGAARTAGAAPGAVLEQTLPAELAEALEHLARREGATLFMVLLAAYQALLGRVARADTVVVGAPVAGRNRRETEGLIGFLVNTLALRGDVGGEPTFRELLGRVRARTLGALDHQELPFERVFAELRPEAHARGGAALQFLFALQNTPPARLELDGVEVRARTLETGRAHAELFLAVQRDPEGTLAAAWEYDTGVLAADEVAALAGAWRALLERVAREPQARPAIAPLLAGEARERELARARGRRSAYPRDAGLFELFERAVERAPDATAVEVGEERTTYAELRRQALDVARELRAAGARREDLVGLCTTRTDALARGALGALRADAAWVPLDPDQPDARLRQVLADAGARLVLCDDVHRARLEALGARCVRLDGRPDPGRDDDGGLPDVRGRGAALAYAMHTSGSTGEPKGVCVPQRAVARLAVDAEFVPVRAGDRVARVSNPAFDAVTWELWAALLVGATLVDVPRDTLLAPTALAACLRAQRVSHMVLTTALFQHVAREVPDAFASMQALLFGGERCDPAAVRAVQQAGPPRHLVHVYGPTETTTFATCADVGPPPAAAGAADERHVSIGAPIDETDVYVLDAALEPVPPGLTGELYVGGDALSRGYLGRGAATAERFVPDPFSAEPGARLYRTGDLARREPDGRIEFVGRRDAQIKLRGFRIEPGEVEAALERCRGVRQAAVALRESGAGERQLVAWVAAPGGPGPDALRRELAERVPAYMVPAVLVVLDALPLGRTGKVDRRALPDPGDAAPAAEDPADAPATPLEETVAAIWCEVLGRERVGAAEDFFELGGHSLLAARVVSRLSAAVGAELELRALFEAPTVRGLAARAAAARGSAELPPLPQPAPTVDGRREGPLSFAQHRLWFLQRLKPESSFYNVPVALRVRGPLDEGAWERAVAALVARHETLRTRIADDGGAPRQVVEPAGPVPLARHDLTALGEDDRASALERALRAECEAPLDLERGPPFRAALIRLAPELRVATLVVHHAMTDGGSLGVLLRDLGELYRSEVAAAVEGRAPRLAPLAAGYIEVARWQRERLAGARGAERLAWWRERLAGAPPALELHPDRPRPAVQGFRGASVPCALPPDLSRRLAQLAREEGATPYMVLLAGFLALLARRSGQRDLVVGTPVAGRDRPELEALCGLFVDTLALRCDLSGDPGFRELLRRARATVLDAFDHRDVPFERVVAAAAPARDTGRSPLFQAMFALQSDDVAAPELWGAEVEPLELPGETAKFDLTLVLREEAGAFAGAFEYDADLFERATVERLAAQLETLLRAAVDAPDRPLSRLAWLDAGERARALALGRGPAPRAPALPVHRLFEERARAAPDAPAVEGGDLALTYRELDEGANRLAHRLRALGVGPEVVVGLCAERSPQLVLAALAVLKAGGAYLPLDPDQPPERTRAMLADAGAPVLLLAGDEARLRPSIPADFAGVLLDVDAVDLADEPATPPAVETAPQGAAYVVFTSGSTGRPKGVPVPHAGLANLVDWHVRAYGVGPGDRATLIAGTSFDASVWETWPYLAAGATLVAVPEAVRLDPPRLVAWMAASGITLTFLPTPLGEALLELAHPAGAPLRAMLVGGDRLHGPGSAPRAYALFNHYGPSEVSVVTSACEVPPGRMGPPAATGSGGTPPPIGRPLPGLRAHVLDEHLEPVPAGVPGELYVGGAGLARGYLGHPRRTAAAFVPDPFAERPGERLYRTGDVVKADAEGCLWFLGRADRQVKVFGLRLELGEVEALLAGDPAVREAAVQPLPGARGPRGLVAYVVPRPGASLDPRALTERLLRALPRSLVPGHWVVLDALPLTPNGKVDRRALPAPDERATGVEVAPATPTERTVAAVWNAVLGRHGVCCATNFFDQGGTSLALLQVQTRLRAALGRDVPVIELFRNPTVASLARWLDGESAEAPAGGTAAGSGAAAAGEAGPGRGSLRAESRRRARRRRRE